MALLVGNAQTLSAFGSTRCKYTPSVGSAHTLSEPMFIFSLALRRLKCSFHDAITYALLLILNIKTYPAINRTANVRLKILISNIYSKIILGNHFDFRRSRISPSSTSSLDGAGGAAEASSSLRFNELIPLITTKIQNAMIRN